MALISIEQAPLTEKWHPSSGVDIICVFCKGCEISHCVVAFLTKSFNCPNCQ